MGWEGRYFTGNMAERVRVIDKLSGQACLPGRSININSELLL